MEKSENIEKMENLESCTICFTENISDPVYLTCEAMHKFCFKCVLKYVNTEREGKSTCPNCRGSNIKFLLNSKFKKMKIIWKF